MKRLITFIFAIMACSTVLFAFSNGTKIGDLYYILDGIHYTAWLTYKSVNNDKYNVDWDIENVTIPETIKYNNMTYRVIRIGDFAFRNCKKLKTVTMGNSITSIERYAFANCDSLHSITIPTSVTNLGECAFKYCRNLKDISLNESITDIKSSTFYSCDSLKSIVIPHAVINVDDNAFAWCRNLKTVIFENSPASIGREAFQMCAKIDSLVLGDSIISIGQNAFYACSNLVSVDIPSTVSNIELNAFINCKKIEAINVNSDNPNYSSLDGVLYNKNITKLIYYPAEKQDTICVVPEGVTEIGLNAFWWANNLKSILFPSTLTNIGRLLFGYCEGITSVTCMAVTPPELDAQTFYGINCSSIPLYVPAESVETYQTTDVWKNFNPILPINTDPTYVGTVEILNPYESKILRDGQIYILRGDKTYTTDGRLVR